jgi:hypothetical protein
MYWAISIAEFWFLWFFAVLLVDFNPFPNVSKNMLARFINKTLDLLTCGLITSRIGRWHLEREKIHGIVRAKVSHSTGVKTFALLVTCLP